MYLDDKCMCIGDLVLRGHMLLHSLSGAADGHQDEGVRKEDDSARYDVAEEEKADNIAHSCGVLAWCMPVDAACCTIRLLSVLSPPGEGTHSKHTSIAPDPSNQQGGVAVRELATCEKNHTVGWITDG